MKEIYLININIEVNFIHSSSSSFHLNTDTERERESLLTPLQLHKLTHRKDLIIKKRNVMSSLSFALKINRILFFNLECVLLSC